MITYIARRISMIKKAMYFYDKKQAKMICKINDAIHKKRGAMINDAAEPDEASARRQLIEHCKYIQHVHKEYSEWHGSVDYRVPFSLLKRDIKNMGDLVTKACNGATNKHSMCSVLNGLSDVILSNLEPLGVRPFYNDNVTSTVNNHKSALDIAYRNFLKYIPSGEIEMIFANDPNSLKKYKELYKSCTRYIGEIKKDNKWGFKVAKKHDALDNYFRRKIVPLVKVAKKQGWYNNAIDIINEYDAINFGTTQSGNVRVNLVFI